MLIDDEDARIIANSIKNVLIVNRYMSILLLIHLMHSLGCMIFPMMRRSTATANMVYYFIALDYFILVVYYILFPGGLPSKHSYISILYQYLAK